MDLSFGRIEEFVETQELQSMEHLAAVRVAIVICESEDVQYMIGRFCKTMEKNSKVFSENQWKRLCGKVRRKLYEIVVPDIIIDIILEKLWPTSYELYKWFHSHGEDFGILSVSKFFWTRQVKIHREKTAKWLIKNEGLDIVNKFKLACYYCLEKEVRFWWKMMSRTERGYFFVEERVVESKEDLIVLYWTYYIQDRPIEYWEFKKFTDPQLFKYAVETGNLSATKFFIGYLNNSLRSRMIMHSFSLYLRKFYESDSIMKGSHFEIGYFLFGQIKTVDIHGFFDIQSYILRRFLEYPLQKYFMTVFDRLMPLNEYRFQEVLFAILEKDMGGFKDFDYKKLFQELWLKVPIKYQTYVSTDPKFGSVMLLKFVKKHFGFVFDESDQRLKEKLRSLVFQGGTAEDVSYFSKENVEFFKFLVLKQVTIKASIETLVLSPYTILRLPKITRKAFENLPLEELKYLMKGILRLQ